MPTGARRRCAIEPHRPSDARTVTRHLDKPRRALTQATPAARAGTGAVGRYGGDDHRLVLLFGREHLLRDEGRNELVGGCALVEVLVKGVSPPRFRAPVGSAGASLGEGRHVGIVDLNGAGVPAPTIVTTVCPRLSAPSATGSCLSTAGDVLRRAGYALAIGPVR